MKYLFQVFFLSFLISCSIDNEKTDSIPELGNEITEQEDTALVYNAPFKCDCKRVIFHSDTTIEFSSPINAKTLKENLNIIFKSNYKIKDINVRVDSNNYHFASNKSSKVDSGLLHSKMTIPNDCLFQSELCYSSVLGWIATSSLISTNKNKVLKNFESISGVTITLKDDIKNIGDLNLFEKQYCRAFVSLIESNIKINICDNRNDYEKYLGLTDLIYYIE